LARSEDRGVGDSGRPGRSDDPAEHLPDLSPGDSVVVEDSGCTRNSCGGCGALTAEPGSGCEGATCGVYECVGPDGVVCVEGIVNGCGGCDVLPSEPGSGCGSCGHYECDDDGGLVCVGSEENACGGCGGPDGVPDEPCFCTGDTFVETHTWVCEESILSCDDGNNDDDPLMALPPTSDSADWLMVRGAIVGGEDTDWYVIDVHDTEDDDGMYPDVILSGLSRDLDICAFWFFDDGRVIGMVCETGVDYTSDDGHFGCCSINAGTTADAISIRNTDWFTDRLDTTPGSDNDSGSLVIVVFGELLETGCSTYDLSYKF
jgi:hypothetical protein